eukprot:10329914-Heterocapsa_arctica.AAC.1
MAHWSFGSSSARRCSCAASAGPAGWHGRSLALVFAGWGLSKAANLSGTLASVASGVAACTLRAALPRAWSRTS